jgi:circadian clock protein KaiC
MDSERHPATQTEPARKVPTGIRGFDEVSRGGLPAGRTTLIIGSPGAGKTIFALQTLVNGVRADEESGIFVAFEENSQQIRSNAAAFGWCLDELAADRLFFMDAYLSPAVMQVGSFDIAGMLAVLEQKAAEMNARRIVFDGIDMLLTLLDDPVAQRREIYRLHEWLVRNELTGIITAKTTFSDPLNTGRWSFMQFMADCVVLLHHRVVDRVALRGARILKYRGSSFSANEHPLVIGGKGIEIATFGPDELDFAITTERVSTGVVPLDDMLGGGYFRGSSVLITGSPGTAKTTLAGAFAAAACSRGERTLYASFDEPANQIARNLRSVGTDLQRCVDEGTLRIYSVRTEVRSAEEHLVVLQKLVKEFEPAALVIDPISALRKSGGQIAAADTAIRLLDLAKSLGITALCTSLVGGRGTVHEATDLEVSTIADTWIHVAYTLQGGERNRAISIVKSRGMAHSNQVRELVLHEAGATLAAVYVDGGEVLMGTARYERERQARTEESRLLHEEARRRSKLERQRVELHAQIAQLQAQLEANVGELERISSLSAARQDTTRETREGVRRLRGGVQDGAAEG